MSINKKILIFYPVFQQVKLYQTTEQNINKFYFIELNYFINWLLNKKRE